MTWTIVLRYIIQLYSASEMTYIVSVGTFN